MKSNFVTPAQLAFRAGTHRFLLSSITAITALFTIVAIASASTYYVSTTGSDSANGSSSTPFLTIQHGINTAQNGDTVILGGGIFSGSGDTNIDFLGKAITVKGNGNPDLLGADPNPITTVNCDQVYGNRGFIFQHGETSSSILEDIFIADGNLNDGGGGTGTGGAIFLNASSPQILNCVFTENTADYGGAIGIENGSSPTIENCIFGDNTCPDTGGAVIIYGGGPNSVFVNDAFDGNTAGSGGAIEDDGASGIFTGCTFTENSATDVGDAIHVFFDGSTATVTNSILYGDTGNGHEIDLGQGSSISVNYCDVQGDYSGTKNINSDPMFPTSLTLGFALIPSSTSACVAAGTISAPDYLPTDILGDARPNPPTLGACEPQAQTQTGIPPVLNSVSPNYLLGGQALNITLSGSSFNSTSVAHLVVNGKDYPLSTAPISSSPNSHLSAVIPASIPQFVSTEAASIYVANSPGGDSALYPFYISPAMPNLEAESLMITAIVTDNQSNPLSTQFYLKNLGSVSATNVYIKSASYQTSTGTVPVAMTNVFAAPGSGLTIAPGAMYQFDPGLPVLGSFGSRGVLKVTFACDQFPNGQTVNFLMVIE